MNRSRSTTGNRASQRRTLGGLAGLAAVVMVVTSTSDARAQTSQGGIAEALFRDGKRLMDAGDFAAACPKLAESQRIDPGGGTLLNLGLCHKGEGKHATASAELREALSAARRDQRADRVQVALQNLAEVEALRSFVVIDVTKGAPDEEVKLDDVVIGPPGWHTRLPIDGGDHRLSASMRGQVFWETTVSIGASKDSQTVTVPEPPPPPPSETKTAPKMEAADTSTTAPSSGRRTLVPGLVVGSFGLVAVGVGAYFGLRAASANADSNKTCPDTACSDATALKQNSDARTFSWIADISIGTGIVGLAVATYLVLIDDAKRTPSARAATSSRITPTVGSSSLGMSFRTTW